MASAVIKWALLFFWTATLHYSVLSNSSSTPCTDGQVWLVQTVTVTAPNTGRLQICKNGTWGTIATNSFDPWSEKNAQVACRQAGLGFSGGINSIFPSTLSMSDRAESTVPVHYAGLMCQGSEGSLLSCPGIDSTTTSFMEGNGFNHLFDVFIVCRPKSLDYSDVHDTGSGPFDEKVGDIRLFGDSGNGRGAVEIYTSTYGWSSLCTDGFDDGDAGVICREFGYSGGSSAPYNSSFASQVGSNPPIRYLYNTQCNDSERISTISTGNLFGTLVAGRCSFSRVTTGTNVCPSGSSLYAGVRCSKNEVPNGSLRLFGGSDSSHGIVEVFYNNKWGMICEGGTFALTEARTVCAQLGFTDSSQVSLPSISSSLLAEESNLKPIWLTTVNCLSSSSTLSSCSRGNSPIGYGYCRVYDLAAVRCGTSSSGGLSSGSITGIIFAVIFILFFIIPFAYAFGRDYWRKRNQHSWYNTLTNPSGWFSCSCFSRTTPGRTVQLNSNATETTNVRATENEEPVEPVVFRPLTRHPIVEAPFQPTEPDVPTEASFTKVPPPTYRAADNFPSITSNPQDLPPPYPSSVPLSAGLAYPTNVSPYLNPSVAQGHSTTPYPSAPLQGGVEYPSETQFNPAYPPPNIFPPTEAQQVPYPVDVGFGGQAYPPPTTGDGNAY